MSYNIILILTAMIPIMGAGYVVKKTRDYLHPAVVMMPLLVFMYSAWPLFQNRNLAIEYLIPREDLVFVAYLYLFGLLAFYLGVIRLPKERVLRFLRGQVDIQGYLFNITLNTRIRKKLYIIAVILGLLAVFSFITMITTVGGFVEAYDSAKGGGYAASGYIGEAVLLSFPAVIILAMSRSGRRLRPVDISFAILMILPQLIQGTFGGRRGPLFLSLVTLFICWYIVRQRKPALKTVLVAICLIGFSVVLVMSQRQHLYIGSGNEFKLERVADVLQVEDLRYSDYIAGVANVIKAEKENQFYYGYRHLVTLFIRPIPRQLWPTKYEDVGADWINERYIDQVPGFVRAVGFAPPSGSAIGFIADLYVEFNLGVFLAAFLFGWIFSAVWRRHRLRGGIWTVLFVEMMILSVYIPTQSFSAWYHRFLFLAIGTIVFWRYFVAKDLRVESRKQERKRLLASPGRP